MVVTEPVRAAESEVREAPSPLDRPLLAGVSLDGQLVAYGLLVLLALALRLVVLGDKPFHHDESQDAYFAWTLFTGGGYKYDPLLHGPFRFYLIALTYVLFGAGDFTARLAPALMGTIMVALPYFLRRQLGSVAAFIAAAVLAVGPAYLYFSRFTREDIYIACLTLALLVTVFCFLDKPRRWQPALLLGLLAASFATKESTYITVFIAGTFFLTTLAAQLIAARREEPAGETPILAAVRSVGLDAWLWGFASFVAVFTLLFTTFFTNPEGLHDGVVKSIQYWLAQQPVGRGDEPWYYYFVLLAGYAWPELILGGVGFLAVLRRPTLLNLFLVWAFVMGLGIYSWAGEKMPWLLIHIMLPLVFLAALGVQTLWQQRERVLAKVGLGVGVIGAVYLVHSATALAYAHPADPEEFLVYTQTSADVPRVRDQIVAIDRRVLDATGQHLKIDVDTWDGVDWPWAWYLRDLPGVSFVDIGDDPGNYTPTNQAILLDDPAQAVLAPKLTGYTGYRFRLRVWWIPDFQHVSLQDWARWLVWRTPWNPEGSLDEWLYVKNDTPGAALVGGVGANGASAPAAAAAVATTTSAQPLPAPTSVTAERVIGPAAGQTNPLDQPRQLAVLADGSLLVIDQGKSAVIKFDPSGKEMASFDGNGTPGGPFKLPDGLGVDRQGNVFIADTWNHRIVKLDASLHYLTAWGTYATTNGKATGAEGQFYGPRAIAIDKQDDVYVTDTGNKRIQEFTNDGKFIAQFGGGGTAPGQLNEPVGLAFAPDSNLVVADTWNRRVQVLTPDGKPVREWVVTSWQTNVHNEPYAAVGANGDVYVTDPNVAPGRVLVYDSTGKPLAVWTLGGTPFQQPTGIAVGPDNKVYVSDSLNHRVVVVAGEQ